MCVVCVHACVGDETSPTRKRSEENNFGGLKGIKKGYRGWRSKRLVFVHTNTSVHRDLSTTVRRKW